MLKVTLLDKAEASYTDEASDFVTLSQQGDQEAFHLLFRRYSKPVLSFIYNLTGNKALAEELTQETFVRAYQNLSKLQDTSKFSSWLFGIAKNIVRENLKENTNNEFLELDQVNLTNQQTPDKDVFNQQINQAIKIAILELSEDWRVVFTLKMLQQKSYEEIAEITGWSIGKIKTDLHRARLALRSKLESRFY
ncbi:MAG: sigma-70 family RNA polymerase sigma factor [Blastocatellia bacterium]